MRADCIPAGTRPLTREAEIQAIERCLARLAELAEHATSEDWWPAEGSADWRLAEVVAHVTEMLPYWAGQAADVAARDADDLPFGRTHDDPIRVEAVRAGSERDIDASLDGMRAACVETVRLLASIAPAARVRTGHHARRGEMTVAQIIGQFMVEHAQEHVDQANAILRRRAATSSRAGSRA